MCFFVFPSTEKANLSIGPSSTRIAWRNFVVFVAHFFHKCSVNLEGPKKENIRHKSPQICRSLLTIRIITKLTKINPKSHEVYMGVSKNNGTPKSSILIGFSIINHPFWGTPILETPIYIYTWYPKLAVLNGCLVISNHFLYKDLESSNWNNHL